MTRPSHRHRIAEEIRARLFRGEIGPSDRLIDHSLAAELGVSRMPVREAVDRLQLDATTVVEPGDRCKSDQEGNIIIEVRPA